MTEQNKVVLISGDNSKFFDQAIFIVKKNIPENKIPVDFVAEAERIISMHLARKRRSRDTYIHFAPEFELDMVKEELARKKRAAKAHIIVHLALITVCVILAYMLAMR